MRKGYNVKLISAIIGLSLAVSTASAKEVTSRFKIPGMDCDACTIVIKRALTKTNGVKTVELSVEKRTATIVYDDTKVTESQIEKAIEKTGYKTEPSN